MFAKTLWTIGVGLSQQAGRLLEEWGLELQVFGVTNSEWMLLSATPISLKSWQTALDTQVDVHSSSSAYHQAPKPLCLLGINSDRGDP